MSIDIGLSIIGVSVVIGLSGAESDEACSRVLDPVVEDDSFFHCNSTNNLDLDLDGLHNRHGSFGKESNDLLEFST